MRRYPRDYLSRMETYLEEDYPLFFESLDRESVSGLHVNTLKTNSAFIESSFSGFIHQLSFIEDGFYAEDGMRLSESTLYHAGFYYIQEPSAQTPAEYLPVEKGDKVLDLCAAPGGKSVQLCGKLSGTGLLVANDISANRAAVLLRNLELAGAVNFAVTAETPEKLSDAYPLFFDKILVDAPCSGEGMFRKDGRVLNEWQKNGPDYYAPLQKSILDTAAKMLKKGGMLMYSTCTFSEAEDEAVIMHFLSSHPGFKTVPLPLKDGFSKGRMGLEDAVRLYPHKITGEGHFMCLLKKENADDEASSVPPVLKRLERKIPKEALSFISETAYSDRISHFAVNNEKILLLPEELPVFSRVRYLRTGLLLGTFMKNRFQPSQALAYALKKGDYPFTADFCLGDELLIRYLKGETISAGDSCFPNGAYVLVTNEGCGCGWAKMNSGNLKNKLDITRRIM